MHYNSELRVRSWVATFFLPAPAFSWLLVATLFMSDSTDPQRRCVTSVRNKTPTRRERAIKHCIFGLWKREAFSELAPDVIHANLSFVAAAWCIRSSADDEQFAVGGKIQALMKRARERRCFSPRMGRLQKRDNHTANARR